MKGVFLEYVVLWSAYKAIVGDKSPVVTCHAQEASQLGNGCWDGPVLDSENFARICSYSFRGDDVAQTFYLWCSKDTFAKFSI